MEGEELHHMSATVVEVVVVEFQGALTTGVLGCSMNNLISFFISFSTFSYTLDVSVLVTGLPSSASWQDLKVMVHCCFLLCPLWILLLV